MTRALLLLLLALPATAGETAVRVLRGGEPMPDAGVKVLPPGAGVVFDPLDWKPDARTDAAGQAVVDVPDGGSLLVFASGFALVPVKPGGAVVDVRMKEERTFAGTVVGDRGQPLRDAAVTLRTTFRERATFRTRTDDKGRFLVYALWLDDYALAVEKPGHVRVAVEGLTEGGATHALARRASLSGTVRDRAGNPLGGAKLRTSWGTVTAGPDGAWRVDDTFPLADGEVALEPPRSGSVRVALAPGEVRTGVDVVALPPAAVRLRVLDQARRPLAGAVARETEGGDEAKSGDDGVVAVAVPPGESAVLVSAKDRIEETVAVPPLRPGETRDMGDLVLRPVPVVEVHVLMPDGPPPANVEDGPG